jgi:hypothetical protein
MFCFAACAAACSRGKAWVVPLVFKLILLRFFSIRRRLIQNIIVEMPKVDVFYLFKILKLIHLALGGVPYLPPINQSTNQPINDTWS